MPEAIRNLMRAGATLEQGVECATRVPARAAGRADIGVLKPGSTADVVVLDGDVGVKRVLVAGVEL
jgi:N-acetylglucosamine-6-phosphate deacetylase